MNVAVLASGAGTNLQALLDRVHGRAVERAGGRERIQIVAVASDKTDPPALERARAADIPTASFPASEYPGRHERDHAMAEWLLGQGAELVVLAGYMQLLSGAFLERFSMGVINVHPALLPAFPGLQAVQQALEYGVKVFGVTVHFVDEGVDSGPIILQRPVEIPDAADAEEVQQRLSPIEHELLPRAVELIAAGGIRFESGNPRRVLVDPGVGTLSADHER